MAEERHEQWQDPDEILFQAEPPWHDSYWSIGKSSLRARRPRSFSDSGSVAAGYAPRPGRPRQKARLLPAALCRVSRCKSDMLLAYHARRRGAARVAAAYLTRCF